MLNFFNSLNHDYTETTVCRSRLHGLKYSCNQEVLDDIRLVFKNCYQVPNKWGYINKYSCISVQYSYISVPHSCLSLQYSYISVQHSCNFLQYSYISVQYSCIPVQHSCIFLQYSCISVQHSCNFFTIFLYFSTIFLHFQFNIIVFQYNMEDTEEYQCAVRLEKYFDKETGKLGLTEQSAVPPKGKRNRRTM